MKILLTGGKGMLGRTICAELTDFEVIPTDLPEADITDAAGFNALLKKVRPDAVIHCAAMTAVDKCESEVDFAYKLNAFGTGNVASACHRNNVRLIAISTDYVFEGNSDRPYHEFDTPSGGQTVYGKSKFAGEEAVRRHCPNHVALRSRRAEFCSCHGQSCRRDPSGTQSRCRPDRQSHQYSGSGTQIAGDIAPSGADRNISSDL